MYYTHGFWAILRADAAAVVEAARTGTTDERRRAAEALRNLAQSRRVKGAIVRAGGVAALVAVVRSGTARARRHAAGALRVLAQRKRNRAEIEAAGAVAALQEMARAAQSTKTKTCAENALDTISFGTTLGPVV